MSLYASCGLGFAVNKLNFLYSAGKDDGITLVDPAYGISLGLRAKLHRYVYMDVSFRFEQILNNEIKPMFFTPEVAVGFRY